VFACAMRLIQIASLLSLALFASGQTAGKDDATADQLIQELMQLPKCAVCIPPIYLLVSDNTDLFIR
jgi:hypothetical protein